MDFIEWNYGYHMIWFIFSFTCSEIYLYWNNVLVYIKYPGEGILFINTGCHGWLQICVIENDLQCRFGVQFVQL